MKKHFVARNRQTRLRKRCRNGISSPESGSQPDSKGTVQRCASFLSVCLSLLLAACGGGGSDEPDPQLAVSETSLEMESVLGVDQTATARFTVSNSGGGTLGWTATTDLTGVSVMPVQGQLEAGEPETVTLALDCGVAALAPAQQPREESGTVNVRATGQANQAREINLRIACTRPEIAVEVLAPKRVEGWIGSSVDGSAEFRFLSSWADQPALDYEATSGDPAAVPSPGSGKAETGIWESISLKYLCETETEFAVTITLRIDGREYSFDWQIACRLQHIAISIREPATAFGTSSGIAGGTVRFLGRSSRQDQPDPPLLTYEVTSDDPRVTPSPSQGIAEDRKWQHVDLIHQCTGENSFTTTINIQIGNERRTFEWQVECGLGNALLYSVEFYQGPILHKMIYNDNGTWDGAWREFFPIAGRDALVVARIHHSMPAVPEAWVYEVPQSTRQRPDLGLEPIHGPNTLKPGEERPRGQLDWPGRIAATPRRSYLYETEYAFFFEGGTQAGHIGFEIDVDPRNLISEGNETDNDRGVAAYWATTPIKPLRIVFVPIKVNGIAPVVAAFGGADALMKDAMDFLPLTGFTARVRNAPMVYSGPHPFDMDHAFEQLKQEWLTDESVADGEFYHGLVAIDGLEGGQAAWNAPDALHRLTPVAVSSLSHYESAASGSRMIAHEIGHNLSLYHAPCGDVDASTIYPHWPKSGGSGGTFDNGGIGPDRGYRFSEMQFVAAGTEDAHDFMSYCLPGFVSPISYDDAHVFLSSFDAHFDGDNTLSWTPGEGIDLSGEATGEAEVQRASLAISGSVSKFGAWSMFAAEETPKSPWDGDGGSYTLRLLDAIGTPLGETRFEPLPLGHGGGQTWGVRIAMPQPVQSRRVQITDGQGQVVFDAPLQL